VQQEMADMDFGMQDTNPAPSDVITVTDEDKEEKE